MDIKRITSALLGFPLVVIILTFGNKYIVDIFLEGDDGICGKKSKR